MKIKMELQSCSHVISLIHNSDRCFSVRLQFPSTFTIILIINHYMVSNEFFKLKSRRTSLNQYYSRHNSRMLINRTNAHTKFKSLATMHAIDDLK